MIYRTFDLIGKCKFSLSRYWFLGITTLNILTELQNNYIHVNPYVFLGLPLLVTMLVLLYMYIKISFPIENTGFIYIIKREDGIYKIGRTNSIQRRLTEHLKDYNKKMKIIYFWPVVSPILSEKEILSLSKKYKYKEKRRLELRKMNRLQLYFLIMSFSFYEVAEKMS